MSDSLVSGPLHCRAAGTAGSSHPLSRGRWLSLLLIAVLLGLASAVPLAVAVGPLPAAEAVDTEAPVGDVRIEVDSVQPRIPRPGGTLRIEGSVRSTGGGDLPDATVLLRVDDQPLVSRAELRSVAQGRTSPGGTPVPDTDQDLRPGAGESVPFTIEVPLADLGLGPFGVYVITVDVVGSGGEGSGSLARVQTFLPWVPAVQEFKETQLSWVWPVVATPRRTEDGLFLDDALARALAEGGRLDRIVEAASDLSVTWVLDPNLLEAVAVMSQGYQVLAGPVGADTEGGQAEALVPGTGQEDARRWLEALREASADDEVVALPYADVDVTGLVAADLEEELATAVPLGRAVAEEILGRPVTADVGWLAGGGIDPDALGALADQGVEAALVDGALVSSAEPLTYTPTGRAAIPISTASPDTTAGSRPATMAGLLSDPALAALLERPDEAPGEHPDEDAGSRAPEDPSAEGDLAVDDALTVQRFLGETAMITAERPGQARAVLVTPPRTFDPDPELARSLLEGTAGAPWLSTAPLSELRETKPPELDRVLPVAAGPEQAGPGAALPTSYLLDVWELAAAAQSFAAILAEPEQERERWERFALRLSSVQWGQADGAASAGQRRFDVLSAAADRVASQEGAVRVVAGDVTFGGRSGTIPVTVVNELDRPVTVQVALVPRTQRLEVAVSEPLTVEAGGQRQVNITGEAVANGIVLVDAVLRTAAGEPFGPSVLVRVRVTEFGALGLALTLGAAAVLFGTATVRLVRRARA